MLTYFCYLVRKRVLVAALQVQSQAPKHVCFAYHTHRHTHIHKHVRTYTQIREHGNSYVNSCFTLGNSLMTFGNCGYVATLFVRTHVYV